MEMEWQRLLFFGAAQGYEDIMGIALKNGADMEADGGSGFTPLLLAAANGHAATVRRLLVAGANVRAVTPDGRTALMLASQQGYADVLKVLLAYGADRKPERKASLPVAGKPPVSAVVEKS
jgi:ankyrin repeat protein